MQEKAKREKKKNVPAVFSAVLMILFFLYEEVYIRAYDGDSFFGNTIWFFVLGAVLAGSLLFVISSLIGGNKVSRWFTGIVIFLFTAYTCIQHCCMSFYMSYFSIATMKAMTGQVVGEFTDTLFSVILDNIVSILIGIIPFVLYCIFAKRIIPDSKKRNVAAIIIFLIIAILAQCGISYMGLNGEDKAVYTYDFSANDSLQTVGLVNTLRLEAQYSIVPKPEAPEIIIIDDPQEEEIELNIIDIDFDAWNEHETDPEIIAMNDYFKTLTGTAKNDYTGIYQGKNLIMICCEAFSPYVISEKLTPTLYRLVQEGFRFNNFYQPLTGQSTSGGEYEMLIGNIPFSVSNPEIEGQFALAGSKDNYLPFTMAHMLAKRGYQNLGWHDNPASVYNRDLSHPNVGYIFEGTETLKMSGSGWMSDEEMFMLTAPKYISDFVDNGTPFSVYYMTVSGHASYTWNHSMAAKHKAEVQAAYPDLPEMTQAYLAASLEIEYALRYLIAELEDAGIADKTVIAMTADHYPYVLLRNDHYHEISGYADSEAPTDTYRNSFILWCGDGSGNVDVDTPCTAIDILPTLLNMFGLEYDSRIITGRDIFADNYIQYEISTTMPIAIIRTSTGYSWRTDAGVYETRNKTFYPNEGVTVDENYVTTVNQIIDNKKKYSQLLLYEDYYRYYFEELEKQQAKDLTQ